MHSCLNRVAPAISAALPSGFRAATAATLAIGVWMSLPTTMNAQAPTVADAMVAVIERLQAESIMYGDVRLGIDSAWAGRQGRSAAEVGEQRPHLLEAARRLGLPFHPDSDLRADVVCSEVDSRGLPTGGCGYDHGGNALTILVSREQAPEGVVRLEFFFTRIAPVAGRSEDTAWAAFSSRAGVVEVFRGPDGSIATTRDILVLGSGWARVFTVPED
jgi:hypothetical protein